jgi:hypothetical protein
MLRSFILLLALPLAACGGGGTNFSINLQDEDGNVAINSDESGRVAVDLPGIEGSLKLPKVDISAADFDVNGVKLYPGSKISNFNLNATDKHAGKDDAHVALDFESPASLEKVQAWFRDKMTERNFKVTPKGNGFEGTTDEGDPIAIELSAAGNEQVRGKLSLGSK